MQTLFCQTCKQICALFLTAPVRHGLSLRPLGAAHGSPSQVQCCTLAGITSKRKSLQKQPKRRKPRLCLGLLLLESGNVLLSRAFAMGSCCAHWAPPMAHLAKYNVARWLEMIRMGRAFPVLCTRKRTQQMLSPFSCGIRQRPTLPGVRHGLSLCPLGAAHGSPSQVQCCTLAGITSKRKSLQKQPKRRKPRLCLGLLLLESGNVLLSRAVSSQVPSALKGLTSVFGMGTGGSLSPLSPECCQGFVQSFVFLTSTMSILNHRFSLGDAPHTSRFSLLLRVP